MGVYFQNHRWPLVSKIWKPSENHWKQWSGGWKSLNGDGWMTQKPLKNHQVQWSNSKKVVNGDGQKVAKPSKNHWCQWFSRKKTIPSHRFQKMTIAHLYLKGSFLIHSCNRVVPFLVLLRWNFNFYLFPALFFIFDNSARDVWVLKIGEISKTTMFFTNQ